MFIGKHPTRLNKDLYNPKTSGVSIKARNKQKKGDLKLMKAYE